MLANLTDSQAKTLRAWRNGRWSAGPGMGWAWERNIAALVEMGLLEVGGHDDCLCRITDAGRAALKEMGE